MKKSIKIIALCLSILALTAFFAGCDMLDEMKANHAVLSDDRETLSFRGETYKKLPEGASLYYTSHYSGAFDDIAVTDEDIPVLLSDTYCHTSQYDKARDIFIVSIWDDSEYFNNGFFYSNVYSVDYSDGTFYCNEKDYNKYIEAIDKNTLDFIGIEYEVNEENSWYYTLDVLSEETSKEILGLVQNPKKMSTDLYSDIIYGTGYYAEIMGYISKCDHEGLLAQSLDNFIILRDEQGNVFLADHNTEKAFKLSDKASSECNMDKYFYGDMTYYPYGEWHGEGYDEDYKEDSAVIIGGADGETDIVVGDANLFYFGL